jgi:hypothetical protein
MNAAIIVARWRATWPRLMKLCPTASSRAVRPFSEASMGGKML